MLGVLVATVVLLKLGALRAELGNKCMCTDLCIHTYIFVYKNRNALILTSLTLNWTCFDISRFADGLDVECEKRGVKNDFSSFGSSH